MAAVVAAESPGSLASPPLGMAGSSDEASVVTSEQISSADGSEGRAARLAAIQEILNQVFEYYSTPSSTSDSRVLTAARFNKLLLDSSVIDAQLPNAKADLVFAKVCGHASTPMKEDQFLDAVVQLAKQKYPQLPRVQGIMKLYCNHFSSFNATAEEPVGGLSPDIVEVLAEARSGLQALYRIYFVDCVALKSVGTLPASFQSSIQDAWVQLLSDYEVLPEFAQKPMVFAAFREVSQLKSMPQRTRRQVLGEDGPDLGRVFTYVHFALALVALARRCFADFGAASLARLFQWMDDSKGHVLAASRGSTSTSGLRILAGHSTAVAAELQLAFFAQAGGEREASARTSSSKSRGSAYRGSASGNRQSLSVGALRKSIGGLRSSQAASSASGGSPTPEWKGRSSPESPSTILARAAQLTEALGGTLAGGSASAKVEALVHELFVHYAAQGDPHNQSHLSLMSFRHFLRDCGLVTSEGSRSDFFEFVPAERVQQARKSLACPGGSPPAAAATIAALPTALRRTSSAGTLAGSGAQQRGAGRQRGSWAKPLQGVASPASPSANERSPPSKRLSATAAPTFKGLPLQVYQQPPLSPVDADLIFVQAIQGAEPPTAQRDLARRRQSSFSSSAPLGGSERPGQRTRMTAAAFSLAVQTLSIAVFRGGDEEAELREIMEEFCGEVLEPLSKILLGSAHQEVEQAAELLATGATALFAHSKPGLERIFAHYARTSQKAPQQHWTSDDISKFVRDFGLAAELGQRPLQQIFRCCVSHERFDLKDMSFSAFQLALVIIAQRIHTTFKYCPTDKVVLLFHRLNAAAREERHAGPKPPNCGSLILGLPSMAALGLQDGPSSPAASGAAARASSASGTAAAVAAARKQEMSTSPASSGARARPSSASRTAAATPIARRQTVAGSGKRQPPTDSWAGLMEDEEALES